MKKKIKITEKQLKMLREQSDEYSSLHNSIKDYMKDDDVSFTDVNELLSSSHIRLSNAISMKDWNEVNDVINDIKKYLDSTYKSKEDIKPEIGDQSSVLDDTDDERDERNYGVNESIKKLKLQFKRFL